MQLHPIRNRRGCSLPVLVLLSVCTMLLADPAANVETKAAPAASSTLSAATVEYRQKLEEYMRARQAYDNEVAGYWNSIVDKRRVRNNKRRSKQEISIDDYVLTQPPVYSGPPMPVPPSGVAPEVVPVPKKYVPVVADFLNSAAMQFNFVPQRPQSEIEYKRAYAKVAFATGLTKDQIVRIYGFEAGGNGTYDVQAGLEYPGPDAQATTTALGYNQLLTTNSVELIAEHGDQFINTLRTKAATLGGASKQAAEQKIEVLQRMIVFSRTVADSWSEHEKIANTPKGLGIHAVNLDVDIGPLLQTQKLVNSIAFARGKGCRGELSAAELEMMNLTGDGNGLDILLMPPAMREQVPTANFFQQSGYEHNPVAIRNNVVAKLLAATNAKMDEESKLQGAKDLAAAFRRIH
jgi:hypothetical protein